MIQCSDNMTLLYIPTFYIIDFSYYYYIDPNKVLRLGFMRFKILPCKVIAHIELLGFNLPLTNFIKLFKKYR